MSGCAFGAWGELPLLVRFAGLACQMKSHPFALQAGRAGMGTFDPSNEPGRASPPAAPRGERPSKAECGWTSVPRTEVCAEVGDVQARKRDGAGLDADSIGGQDVGELWAVDEANPRPVRSVGFLLCGLGEVARGDHHPIGAGGEAPPQLRYNIGSHTTSNALRLHCRSYGRKSGTIERSDDVDASIAERAGSSGTDDRGIVTTEYLQV
jgi:hypothetical protein